MFLLVDSADSINTLVVAISRFLLILVCPSVVFIVVIPCTLDQVPTSYIQYDTIEVSTICTVCGLEAMYHSRMIELTTKQHHKKHTSAWSVVWSFWLGKDGRDDVS
jgi:hypothetical protein